MKLPKGYGYGYGSGSGKYPQAAIIWSKYEAA
jgi:hypothetical protein